MDKLFMLTTLDTTALWAALIGAAIGASPGFILSLVTFPLTKKSNRSLEQLKTNLQQEVIQFTKWHEERIESPVTIYQTFCDYLEFLRDTLYLHNKDLSRMHDFDRIMNQQMLYLDDTMAQKISQYRGELLLFFNTSMRNLTLEGEGARERIREQLDFEIPAYLTRLQEDINKFLDPNFKQDDKTFRQLIVEWRSNHRHSEANLSQPAH
jgi:hypothetical protein